MPTETTALSIRATRIYHGEWIAVDDDTYDGAEDSQNQCGVGSTEQEAIDNLKEKLEAPRTHLGVTHADIEVTENRHVGVHNFSLNHSKPPSARQTL